MGVLQDLNKIDKKISKWIHSRDNILTTVILYPFAAFFHPGLIWLAYLSIFSFSDHNIRLTVVYALGTLICLLTTVFIKKLTKRPRPQLNTNVRKPHHFRKKQKNNAMPSGDSIQAALFSVFLYHLGVWPILIVLFHIGVCMGRVYYMCHWVADTFVATILGGIIGNYLLALLNDGNFEFLPVQL